MKFIKACIITILFIILNELVWLWHLVIPDTIYFSGLYEISDTINNIIFFLILIALYKRFENKDALEFKETTPKFKVLGIVLGIAYVFFQALLNFVYHFEFSSDFYAYDFTLERLYSFFAISTILIVPIIEELFFRNYIQHELSKQYKPYTAIFFASLLFAFIHLPFEYLITDYVNFSFHHAYIAFFGGLVAGTLFYKSKSIIPAILFHIFWNLTVSVV